MAKSNWGNAAVSGHKWHVLPTTTLGVFATFVLSACAPTSANEIPATSATAPTTVAMSSNPATTSATSGQAPQYTDNITGVQFSMDGRTGSGWSVETQGYPIWDFSPGGGVVQMALIVKDFSWMYSTLEEDHAAQVSGVADSWSLYGMKFTVSAIAPNSLGFPSSESNYNGDWPVPSSVNPNIMVFYSATLAVNGGILNCKLDWVGDGPTDQVTAAVYGQAAKDARAACATITK